MKFSLPNISKKVCITTHNPLVKEGDSTLMKIGDRFKDKITGKIYIIRSDTDSDTLLLEGENGLGRRLIDKKSLERTCEKLEDIKS